MIESTAHRGNLSVVNHMRAFLILLGLSVTAMTLSAQSDWDDPFPPHRIADHLYYVGSKGLASYLVTTTNGHILINSSFERTVPMIRTNIESLRFKFNDIKILLTSHAHSDHASGHALVKELTGARVEVMQGDAPVIANGGKGQYLYTDDDAWKSCVVDRVLKDGDTVTLGEASLTARLTPGHTQGCTTWLMTAMDHGKPLKAVIIGSPNVNQGYVLVKNLVYPEIATDYEKTFRLLKSLPCDIFLGAHGSYYGMEDKYARLRKNPKVNPFIDPQGYQSYVEDRAKAFHETLRKQGSSATGKD
ncbi:MAG TPA: subclass B3 metallo-beta-lactamase [Candidatus Saccharimonadales bacterium]|nr:subclass B3 metallo-beta-lactamase [Candidatus Saccharimonadales bacterium]